MLTKVLSSILFLYLSFYAYSSYAIEDKIYIQTCFLVYDNEEKVGDVCIFAIIDKDTSRRLNNA